MDRDRSLDEFVGGQSDGSADSNADDDPADSDGDDGPADPDVSRDADSDPVDSDGDVDSDPVDSDADDDSDLADRAPDTDGSGAAVSGGDEDDVEPAAVTYRWDPDGVPCSECGSTADRLWSGESGQVCAACKEW